MSERDDIEALMAAGHSPAAINERIARGDGELADRLLRRFARECLMVENGIALIDSGWVNVDEEEAAYLERVQQAVDDEEQARLDAKRRPAEG